MQILCHNIKRRPDQRSALLCVGVWYQNFYFISSCQGLLQLKSKGWREGTESRRGSQSFRKKREKSSGLSLGKKSNKASWNFCAWDVTQIYIYLLEFILSFTKSFLSFLIILSILHIHRWYWVAYSGVIKCYIWNSQCFFFWGVFFSALIVFLFPHAFLIGNRKLWSKGKKEVGIDASFRLIRGMICCGVSEINQSVCGIRIQGENSRAAPHPDLWHYAWNYG